MNYVIEGVLVNKQVCYSPIAAPPGTRWRHSGIIEKYRKKENQRSENYLEKP